MAIWLITTLTSVTVAASIALAQAPPVRVPVTVGLGLDTTAAPLPELLTLWRRYLQSGPYDPHRTPYWSVTDQDKWPKAFDLTTPWCYGSREDYANSQAAVLDIAPATFRDTTAYSIQTLFTYQDTTMARPLPYAVCRVYAVRQSGHWVLTNALGQLTRDWQQLRIGPITFVYPSAHRFNRERAAHSAVFVDSVASAFGANRPKPINFYIADSPQAMFRLLGIDALPNHTPGLAYTTHRMIFSGSPVYGEWYPHELAHMALDSLTKSWRTPFALDEGLAMWLGGSRGSDFSDLMTRLAAALRARPSLSIDSLLGSPSPADTLAYPAAAALLQMAYERGRMVQVKAFLSARHSGEAPDTILDMAERTFGESRKTLDALWRATVLRYDQTGAEGRKGA